eukprot:TRINITY_DN3290_c0_g1_i1.p2 TRINITY_DN3290_c0_g1~~TRINITY_DN3290_c0_g1_i1.p2  ORF type:complete len:140 (+),score=20.95 TRINITY_DN3290_c0_g1_i1:194-613(+)
MLKVLVFLPVVGAILLAVLPVRRALPLWQVAMAFALASLGYALWLATQFEPAGAAIQMFESRAWNVRLGSYFALGVDGISLAKEIKSEQISKGGRVYYRISTCLLYTSDAADDMQCVDLGGRRIIKKKKNTKSSSAAPW